jgi:hypothetical protein
MKLRNAKFYTKVVRKNYKNEYALIISEIKNQIENSSLSGYSTTIVSIKSIMKIHKIEVDNTKFGTLRNLIIKTIQTKGFGFKTNSDDTINIYW